jgi:hypothetical protein
MRGLEATELLFADSVTQLDAGAAGRVVVCASHGGAYVAVVAAARRVAAIVLNDAGVGLDDAGIAGLALLDTVRVAGVTVSNASARIGDARDTFERGRVSHVNDAARRLGCAVDMPAASAAELLRAAAAASGTSLPQLDEASFRIAGPPAETWALDSASLVGTEHTRAVVFTGSHGGLLGGRPEAALKADVLGAVFNDAGRGIDDAGCGRLAALDARAIPAAVVDARTARIGDGRSTYFDGVISAVNATAARLGARADMAARVLADLIHESRQEHELNR